jgi:diacylglycerol kinase family enzyme
MTIHVDVIATTISGSVKDWGKVKEIVPLFQKHGMNDVELRVVESHADARRQTGDAVKAGGNHIISAGGSGTFNAVLEGCFDSGRDLTPVRLGFLRKGSADLIGKALGLPDEIDRAIEVFARAIREDRTVPCDVIRVTDGEGKATPRRFVGYGGAEIFGRIPHFTEHRFTKYYKGILGQLFGDLGPFFVGSSLATLDKLIRRLWTRRRRWRISVDGQPVDNGTFQAMLIVNGYLGPDLPFAKDEPLGSGKFYLFTIADLGVLKLPGQLKRCLDSSIMDDPTKYGFGAFTVTDSLVIEPEDGGSFPVNTDGSIMPCRKSARLAICDQIQLLA